jgi:hypothetical protein
VKLSPTDQDDVSAAKSLFEFGAGYEVEIVLPPSRTKVIQEIPKPFVQSFLVRGSCG